MINGKHYSTGLETPPCLPFAGEENSLSSFTPPAKEGLGEVSNHYKNFIDENTLGSKYQSRITACNNTNTPTTN